MIVHIALYTWKKGTPTVEVERVSNEIRSLGAKVPGLINVMCGENFSRWNDGYTTAFVVIANDRAALEAYRKHPDHLAAAKKIDGIEEKSIGFDFEA